MYNTVAVLVQLSHRFINNIESDSLSRFEETRVTSLLQSVIVL